ncbi:MAG: FAD-dependent oxidoreductase [Actinomycetota bacterium]
MERVDVAIVGGGPMGTAAARALSARGRAVALLERFTFGHANGSTAGATRNFRLTYHDPIYVRMARLALERWRELEDEAGVELMRVVGGIDVGKATELSARALEAAGERLERPSDAEVAERWPMLRFPPRSSFVYQPDGAILRSHETVKALARLAARHGADLREETAATGLHPQGDGVEVTTAGGDTIRASVAIVAAGAWAGSLLGRAGIPLPLRPTLEQSTYFEVETADLPTVIDWDEAPMQPPYLVPDPFVPGTFKAGAHLSGPVVDPDRRTFEPDEVRETRMIDWVRRRMVPAARSTRTETCLYTTTPDEDFVLERIGPLVVASPCSGHGFKFTPLIGEVVADLADGEAPEIPLDRFRARRPALRS